MSRLEWPVVIHELGLGFSMKDIWEERAKAQFADSEIKQ